MHVVPALGISVGDQWLRSRHASTTNLSLASEPGAFEQHQLNSPGILSVCLYTTPAEIETESAHAARLQHRIACSRSRLHPLCWPRVHGLISRVSCVYVVFENRRVIYPNA